MVIPYNFASMEFYHIQGQGYHLRFKNQEHPTAFIGMGGYTYFEDMDSGRVKKVDPKDKVTYPLYGTEFTENLHERLVAFFSLHQVISWNYHQWRDVPIPKLIEEAKMLRYLDLIRDYYYGHATKYGNDYAAMRFTSNSLWFLSQGGMCWCGNTRQYHPLNSVHEWECDFTYAVTERVARILQGDHKIEPGGYQLSL